MIFPAAARAQNSAPVGELYPADNGAPLQTLQVGTGMPVVAGSELSAGAAPARFRLNRGGQMRLCPRSNLTVNSGTFGLMFTMTAGAMEVDYRLAPRGSDILLTPDFSLQLTGPGVYHFAIGVDKTGNTCFKSLPGNVSQVVLSELLGTATYRPKPGDALTFEGGKLASASPLAGNCGCPPAGPVMVAAGPLPEALKTVSANGAAPASGPATAAATPGNSQLPPDQPGQVHVEVDTPFVFSARSAKPYSVAKINFATLPNVLFLQERVDPVVLVQKPAEVSPAEENEPVATVRAPGQKKENKGFFGKLKGFFGSIFHR